ncbi:MAG: RdgB/HAM1 family non-canonical purine NTP pyrophosphatase [Phycisphaerales bacterium]|nr:RdgB/HAM1 family non-canonical purine NTP pyrophosphatase [Phycisphaerales bacterium]
MPLLLATTNPHKLDEVRAMAHAAGLEIVGLDAVGRALPEPEENGATFAANARIKAAAYASETGWPCLADDSGLEVDALDGAPGVHSARYAGIGDTRRERDEANNTKLLAALRDVPDGRRTARFVCAMCLAAPDGRVLAETRGVFEGRVAREPRGTNGFGYDPLLVVPDLGRTSAELPPAEKNARSHRGAALRLMFPHLAALAASRIPSTSRQQP